MLLLIILNEKGDDDSIATTTCTQLCRMVSHFVLLRSRLDLRAG